MIDPPVAPHAIGSGTYDDELAAAIEAARAGGAAIRSSFGEDHEVTFKSGDDPLTAADAAADRRIKQRLIGQFPTDGWLSEESDGQLLDGSRRLWVVDPLDGTREFVQHIPEFAVSIALLVEGRPLVAVVYNPIRDLLVAAVEGRGVRIDDRTVVTSSTSDLSTAVVLASRSEIARGDWLPFEPRCRVVAMGSIAYKLALVASGEADATISLAPKHGWDICAGVLLVEEAGGVVSGLDGQALEMADPTSLVDGLVAGGARIHGQVLAAVGANRRPA
jgi:myo-inositol-1(or 4)-monophosphatase